MPIFNTFGSTSHGNITFASTTFHFLGFSLSFYLRVFQSSLFVHPSMILLVRALNFWVSPFFLRLLPLESSLASNLSENLQTTLIIESRFYLRFYNISITNFVSISTSSKILRNFQSLGRLMGSPPRLAPQLQFICKIAKLSQHTQYRLLPVKMKSKDFTSEFSPIFILFSLRVPIQNIARIADAVQCHN